MPSSLHPLRRGARAPGRNTRRSHHTDRHGTSRLTFVKRTRLVDCFCDRRYIVASSQGRESRRFALATGDIELRRNHGPNHAGPHGVVRAECRGTRSCLQPSAAAPLSRGSMISDRSAGISPRKPEPPCRRCGYRTRLVPNPYFGAGLAVHRYLRVCRRCDWAGIVREAPAPAPDPRPEPAPVEKEVAKRRAVFRARRRLP
jgi:hypothetical protein